MRDAALLKTIYAFGLRRREAWGLDLADLRHNPKIPAFGRYGGLFVRWGKSSRGSPPKRRTVLTVPEMDWIVSVLEQWRVEIRPAFGVGAHPALWVTERASRLSMRSINEAFTTAPGCRQAGPLAGSALPAPLLRHPSGRVRLSGEVRLHPGRAHLRRDDRDLHRRLRRVPQPATAARPGPTPRAVGGTVNKKMSYQWNLRKIMATRDMFATTDLVPLLGERGIHLSREQVFRLVTTTPQRLSLDTLAALCDILDVGVEDLIEITATNTQVAKTAGGESGSAPPAVRSRTTIRRPKGL